MPTAWFYYLFYGGRGGALNAYRYFNPKLEDAIYGTTRAERNLRLAATREGQRIFMEDLIIIPIAHTGNDHVIAPFLDIPFGRTANGHHSWKDITIV